MAQINLGLQPLESPSLRGSGLKFFEGFLYQLRYTSPSLRGSGLKWNLKFSGVLCHCVSLFTREWIEIDAFASYCAASSRLPLYEGVD